jgi:hypothetical protein
MEQTLKSGSLDHTIRRRTRFGSAPNSRVQVLDMRLVSALKLVILFGSMGLTPVAGVVI